MASSPLTPLTASSMLSAMGCEKFQITPGDLFQLAVHGGDQFVFVLMEHGTPFFLRLQIDEVFGIEKASGVGSVVGSAHLAGCHGHFRETRPISAAPDSPRRMPSVGPVLGARVPRTQMAPSSRCGRNSDPMIPLINRYARRGDRGQRPRQPPHIGDGWPIAQLAR